MFHFPRPICGCGFVSAYILILVVQVLLLPTPFWLAAGLLLLPFLQICGAFLLAVSLLWACM
jgi:hypothetical protein